MINSVSKTQLLLCLRYTNVSILLLTNMLRVWNVWETITRMYSVIFLKLGAKQAIPIKNCNTGR